MENQDTILEMRGIVKEFPGVKALDKAHLTIKKGQVHALIGENGAGKSTLMKILLGMYSPDEGEIFYRGAKCSFNTPYEALNSGISMIHQEISLIPSMDISENVWIGREKKFTSMGIINHSSRYNETGKLLKHLGIKLNPKTIVKSLNVADMQLVELVRAVSYDSDIIIMDEPTSSLTDSEVEILYRIIRELSAKGTSIIFISHKLEEIFEICDHVTVLRDGKYISDHTTSSITKDELITKIAGREITNLYPKQPAEIKGVVLKVKDLCSGNKFKNVNFEVREGEILGVCGLVGAGRTEIMSAIFGVDKYDSGEIYLNDVLVKNRTPSESIKNGFAMVTEDRRQMGIIPSLGVGYNTSIAYLKGVCTGGFIDRKQENIDVQEYIKKLEVKTPSLKTKISALSGGNQQKSILGRWLMVHPKILILDEPTKGIDVSSKSEIHYLISTLAQQGMAVILISSDLPEVLGMSDRIIVVKDGELVANVNREDATQEMLLSHAFGTFAKV